MADQELCPWAQLHLRHDSPVRHPHYLWCSTNLPLKYIICSLYYCWRTVTVRLMHHILHFIFRQLTKSCFSVFLTYDSHQRCAVNHNVYLLMSFPQSWIQIESLFLKLRLKLLTCGPTMNPPSNSLWSSSPHLDTKSESTEPVRYFYTCCIVWLHINITKMINECFHGWRELPEILEVSHQVLWVVKV